MPRGWSDPALLATSILMAWSDSSTITDRFAWSRRLVADALPARASIGQTYQGFIKTLMSRGDDLLDSVQAHLRTEVERIAGDHWLCEGWLVYTVDGTEIDCPRTRANEEFFGIAARKGSGPQQQLTSILHMGTMLPWAWRSGGACVAERTHLRDMIDRLPPGSLLVADAGFTGYDLLRTLRRQGLHFLIRVGANLTLLTKLGFEVHEKKSTVYLWPQNHRNQPPLALRLIRFKQRGGRSMVLLTSVHESTRLSRRQARNLYRQRWGVEVFH